MLKHIGCFLLAAAGALAPGAAHAGAAPLSPDDLARQAAGFLREQAAGYPGQPRIVVEPPRIERLAACRQSEVFLPSGARLRPRITVGIRCLAPQAWVTYTQASLSIEGVYYVASRSLRRGTVLSRGDVSPREGDLLRLAPGTVYDMDRLAGSVTTQRIGAGSPLKTNALRSPDSIARGQAVRLEARGIGFVATSEGVAMQGGEPGARIQVRAASGQTVSGTVLDANTVLVMM